MTIVYPGIIVYFRKKGERRRKERGIINGVVNLGDERRGSVQRCCTWIEVNRLRDLVTMDGRAPPATCACVKEFVIIIIISCVCVYIMEEDAPRL